MEEILVHYDSLFFFLKVTLLSRNMDDLLWYSVLVSETISGQNNGNHRYILCQVCHRSRIRYQHDLFPPAIKITR